MVEKTAIIGFVIYLITGLYLINITFNIINLPQFIINIERWIILIAGILVIIGGVNYIRVGNRQQINNL